MMFLKLRIYIYKKKRKGKKEESKVVAKLGNRLYLLSPRLGV